MITNLIIIFLTIWWVLLMGAWITLWFMARNWWLITITVLVIGGAIVREVLS